MANSTIHKVHDNAVRDEWLERIGKLNTLEKGVKALLEFRRNHTTPLRQSYELDLDCNWIERKLEEKVACLREQAFKNDHDLLHKCATGADAANVANAWLAKMAACKDKWEAEKIHIGFRIECKTPIMPTNYFMDTDRILGSSLMELRNLNYYDTPLAELRKRRGVKVIVANETAH